MDEEHRSVRLFISSTFADMRREREELIKRVLPGLQARCEQAGIGWGEVDLRWGIPESEVEAGRTLAICFEEIVRSLPFFLVLLGHRYGTIAGPPGPELLKHHSWLAAFSERSITELEIRCAQQRCTAGAHGKLVLLREDGRVSDEAERAHERLAALKRELHAGPWRIERYRDPSDLTDLVVAAYGPWIDALGSRARSARPARGLAKFAPVVNAHRRDFIDRSEPQRWLRRVRPGISLLCGEAGSGRTALLAWLAGAYEEQRERNPRSLFDFLLARNPRLPVLAYFVGATGRSDVRELVRELLAQARECLHQPALPEPEPTDAGPVLVNALHQLDARGGALLIVDGLASLALEPGRSALDWLPEPLPRRVRVVFSCTAAERDAWFASGLRAREYALQALAETERSGLIERYLSRFGKRLSADLKRRIAARPETASPGHLRLLLDELRCIGQHDEVDAAAQAYAATSGELLLESVVARWRVDYEIARPGLVLDMLYLLFCSRRGLSHSELSVLLGAPSEPLPQHVFWPFYTAIRGLLIDRGTTLDIGSAALLALLRDHREALPRQRRAFAALAAHFARRPFNRRVVEELPWAWIALSRWEGLAALLLDLDFIEQAWAAQPAHVLHFWRVLEHESPHRVQDAYRGVPAADPRVALLARIVWRAGHPRAALGLLPPMPEVPAVGTQEPSVRVHERALLLAANGDWRGAARHFARVADGPDASDALRLAALGNLGAAAFQSGDLAAAAATHARELALAQMLSDPFGETRAAANLALVRARQGRPSDALRELRRLSQRCRIVGDVTARAMCLANQGAIEAELGRTRAAMHSYRIAGRLAAAVNDRCLTLRCQLALGGQQLAAGLFDDAMDTADALERVASSSGDPGALAQAAMLRARVYANLGQHRPAQDMMTRASKLLEQHVDVDAERELETLRRTLTVEA